MKTGWTGGQYSIVRAACGAGLFVYFVALVARDATPLLLIPAVAALCLAIGWLDRASALFILMVLGLRHPPAAGAWLLLWHVFLPPAPFLSLAARGRVDPRGGWSMSRAMFVAAALVIVVTLGRGEGTEKRFALLALAILFVPMVVPRREPEATDEVFYDGTCGLCHSGMRWLVAEDPTGTSFRYAPLFGDAFAAAFPNATDLPDSVIVKTAGGAVLVRSDAAVHLLGRLGGLWRIFGIVFGALPRRWRDAMYDFIASVRYRIFGRKKDACPLMPPDLRSRFTV
ncbi:MAG TPA: DCC1-like thiol-disulfide oxidoreductase family protein [Thermoanaerobaculia bacterium]|nr:DCC1-like thiol-disulfide oxidoreductase family protein [Thermoanaerobaculia bacterium]